jgi:hypothetical protein
LLNEDGAEYGFEYPTPFYKAGVYTATNYAIPGTPAGATKEAGYLFFMIFYIHEDNPGEARLWLNEEGTINRVFLGSGISWTQDPGVDGGDITDHTNVTVANLREPLGCYDKLLIYMDMCTVSARTTVVGNLVPQGMRKTLVQNFTVTDASNNNTPVATATNNMWLRIGLDGKVTSSP